MVTKLYKAPLFHRNILKMNLDDGDSAENFIF